MCYCCCHPSECDYCEKFYCDYCGVYVYMNPDIERECIEYEKKYKHKHPTVFKLSKYHMLRQKEFINNHKCRYNQTGGMYYTDRCMSCYDYYKENHGDFNPPDIENNKDFDIDDYEEDRDDFNRPDIENNKDFDIDNYEKIMNTHDDPDPNDLIEYRKKHLPEICYNCDKLATKHCPCNNASYCSKNCQIEDWTRHKTSHKK